MSDFEHFEKPSRVAWCTLLFALHGGRFSRSGLPVFDGETADTDQKDGLGDGLPIRGKCDRGYDCGHCYALKDWLQVCVTQGWEFGWECDKCLRETERPDKETVLRSLPGIYQSGVSRDEDDDYNEHEPGIGGCTRCGWGSSLLQLVLRRPR